MASIFLCHASEDKHLVEPMQLALAGAGHDVFYDDQSLRPGGDFHQRIHRKIGKCDLFIFVATPASIAQGKFTLSELKFARQRWPSPVHRVLPVVVHGLAVSDLPQYLQAATVLKIDGNAATEVLAASTRMLAVHRRRRVLLWGSILATTAAAIALIAFYVAPLSEQGPVATDTARAPKPSPMTGSLIFTSERGDYIGNAMEHRLSTENGIVTGVMKDGSIAISFEGDDNWSAEFAAPRGRKLGVGRYQDAQRYPFNNPIKPGMSVSGAGRGCNELSGEFEIERLETVGENSLRDLKLTFKQRCDGGQGQLFGTIEVKAAAGA